MNKYYTYEHIDLWDEAVWKDRISQVHGLVQWIGEHDTYEKADYTRPVNGLFGDECRSLDYYSLKTNSVNIPEVIEEWRERGVFYDCRSQGGFGWIIMAPLKCLDDYGRKLPTILVMAQDDITDPYWAMKTLDRYRDYNDMVAESQEVIFFYLVKNVPVYDRVFVNILQEAFVFVPGDVKELYLDVSTVYKSGHKLADLPGFVYKDRQGGNIDDPDGQVKIYGSAGIPVLDITGRWENRCSLSRDQVAKGNWSSGDYDLERVIHSETGRRIAEGMVLEYEFDTVYDPGFLEYWEKRGLKYVNHELKQRRWKAAVPLDAFDNPDKKLPVICVLQEVNHANEHLAVTEASYFYEYFRIASQGECILINFVLEDHEGNELLAEIIEEASRLYPMMDRSRIYLAGHSHNGYYSLEFAVRHPDLIAAVATFGDLPGFFNSELFPTPDEKIERMSRLDIPVINLAGCCEPRKHFPLHSDGTDYREAHKKLPVSTFEDRAASWQLRLKASNCPMKSLEDIRATRESPEKAIRMLGVPGEWSETQWRDGFEVYIVKVKNNQGKFHLCMVGEENMPHNTTPVQQEVSWSFLRGFARDQETGKIIEL